MINPTCVSLELKAGEIQVSDPTQVLGECIIFFAFPKSRSANFPIALSLAQSATAYGEQNTGGRILYWAGFTKSASDIERATELLRLAGNWVGVMAKVNGHKVARPFNAYLTLSCYQDAIQCSNHAAHCQVIIEDPFHPNYDSYSQTVKRRSIFLEAKESCLETEEEIKEFVFPCKKMLQSSMFHPQFNFKKSHNISHEEQIQAAAVEYGISICPLFDAAAFKEVGSHKIRVDLPISNSRTPSVE